jgi:hypothetical protein
MSKKRKGRERQRPKRIVGGEFYEDVFLVRVDSIILGAYSV